MSAIAHGEEYIETGMIATRYSCSARVRKMVSKEGQKGKNKTYNASLFLVMSAKEGNPPNWHLQCLVSHLYLISFIPFAQFYSLCRHYSSIDSDIVLYFIVHLALHSEASLSNEMST